MPLAAVAHSLVVLDLLASVLGSPCKESAHAHYSSFVAAALDTLAALHMAVPDSHASCSSAQLVHNPLHHSVQTWYKSWAARDGLFASLAVPSKVLSMGCRSHWVVGIHAKGWANTLASEHYTEVASAYKVHSSVVVTSSGLPSVVEDASFEDFLHIVESASALVHLVQSRVAGCRPTVPG